MENSNKRKTQKRQAGSIVRRCLLLLFGVTFIVGAFISARVLLERRSAANAYKNTGCLVCAGDVKKTDKYKFVDEKFLERKDT